MSKLRDIWAGGGTALGAWLSIPSPESAEVVARAGYDYVCIDMQHGLADYQTALRMLQVIGLGDATPVVRVPWNEPGIIGRALDAGAMAIIIPMVNDVAAAASAVAACRYAPAGSRSFGPTRAAMQEGRGYFDVANSEVACIPMIETQEAMGNLDDILTVEGVDAVYVGPADLSVSHGLPPGNNDDEPVFADALTGIVEACGRSGVVPGIHGTPGLAGRRRDAGFRMITVSTDMVALGGALRKELQQAREGEEGGEAGSGGERIY